MITEKFKSAKAVFPSEVTRMHAYFQSYDQNNPPYMDNSHYCFISTLLVLITGHTQEITYLVAVLYQAYNVRRGRVLNYLYLYTKAVYKVT